MDFDAVELLEYAVKNTVIYNTSEDEAHDGIKDDYDGDDDDDDDDAE